MRFSRSRAKPTRQVQGAELDVQRELPSTPLRIFDERLHVDPTPVVLRPFHLRWHTTAGIARARRVVQNICALSEPEAADAYERVLHDFSERHWQTEHLFEQRYKDVRATLWIDDRGFSELRKRLIGSYFCHEYTYAAAALMNPSMVPHPDQSGIKEGACRSVMSLRAVGEDHISSVGAMAIERQVLTPCGISDSAVGFATAGVDDILALTE
jgi:hypothetical protein